MQLSCFILLLNIGEMLWSYRKYQAIELWNTLDRIVTKNVLAQTIQKS